MAHNAASIVGPTTEELKAILECPVCRKVPRKGPVYQCESGHCVCTDCYSQLTQCPVCRIHLGLTRNRIFEQLLPMLPHACKFEVYGCGREESTTALESHEKECPYRLVRCFWLQCKTRGPMHELLQHKKEFHRLTEYWPRKHLASSFVIVPSVFEMEECYAPKHIEVEGRQFFQELWRCINGHWFMWVYMMGSKTECDKYTFTVKLVSPDRNLELMHRDSCIPLDVTKEEIAEVRNCLTFTDNTAKRLIHRNKIQFITVIDKAFK